MQKYGRKMQQQSNAMRNQIDLSRSCNSNCKTEIMICTNRLQCLSEILVGTEKSFADYCVNLWQTASASCSVNSRGTANESAVGHLGAPCKDHESLYTLQQFKQMASAFAKVSSEAELGAKKVKGILGHWDELLGRKCLPGLPVCSQCWRFQPLHCRWTQTAGFPPSAPSFHLQRAKGLGSSLQPTSRRAAARPSKSSSNASAE